MSSTAFVGDLHLGKRLPHATAASQARFELYRAKLLRDILANHSRVIQLGDLFDSPAVSIPVFYEGVNLMRNFDHVLKGNHDFLQDRTKQAAFDYARKLTAKEFGWSQGSYGISCGEYGGTQLEFEAALDAARGSWGNKEVLALHCNVAKAVSEKEIENTLTEARARELLNFYQYVICGHEHNARTLFSGRLIMLGSILPFTFGEMTDKYIAVYEDGKMRLEKIWSAEQNYLKIDLSNPETDTAVVPGAQFYELVGEITSDRYRELAELVSRLLKGDYTFAVKNSTTVLDSNKHELIPTNNTNWLEMIYASLCDEDKALLQEYR